MIWGTLVLLVVAVVVVLFVLQPIWHAHRRHGASAALPTALLDLFAERDVVLAALRDLQLDYETGKVAATDYERMRRALMAEAARILQAIEELNQVVEVEIDQEIAHLRELARQIDANASTSTAGVST